MFSVIFSFYDMKPKMSFREPFNFPYVTASIPRWNPTSVADVSGDERVLKPGEDASVVLSSYDVVKLERGATYHWHDVDIKKPVTVYGNGAVIRCPSVSYCLRVNSPGVRIFDCIFVGKRSSRTDEVLERNGYFGLLLHNSTCVISGCSFVDFFGAALCVYDDGDARSGNNAIDRCSFYDCKAGLLLVSVGGDNTDGGLVFSSRFDDCQYGVYAVSMSGWRIRDCLFNKCCSGVFHVKKSLMSYGDAVPDGEVGGFGLVSGCMFRASKTSNWPSEVSLLDNSKVKLAGFYFDDDSAVPIKLTDSFFVDSDIGVGKMSSNFKTNFVIGCSFWYNGSGAVSSFDVIRGLSSVSADTIYFSGCSGRNGCKAVGLTKACFDDDTFLNGITFRRGCDNKKTTTR